MTFQESESSFPGVPFPGRRVVSRVEVQFDLTEIRFNRQVIVLCTEIVMGSETDLGSSKVKSG